MTFSIEGKQFLRDGKPVKIISGAVHYFRNLPDTWPDIFQKMRALGCNTVETYCAWNLHEPHPGEFDFSGALDLSAFLDAANDAGLMAIVRPGPYICAEWDFGGLPWWLQNEPGIEIRSISPMFKNRKADPYWVRYEYSEAEQNQPIHQVTHGGQEFNYVLEGTVCVTIGKKDIILNAGDCVYFDPMIPHGQSAVDGPTTFLTVITNQTK